MEYTKGKWEVSVSKVVTGEFYSVVSSYRKHQFEIAKIMSAKEDKANAQLIASAPDLYEALKAIDGYLSAPFPANITRKKSAVELLDKALAKVEKLDIKK